MNSANRFWFFFWVESLIQKWVECKYNHEVHLLNSYFSSQIFDDFSKCQKNERKNLMELKNRNWLNEKTSLTRYESCLFSLIILVDRY